MITHNVILISRSGPSPTPVIAYNCLRKLFLTQPNCFSLVKLSLETYQLHLRSVSKLRRSAQFPVPISLHTLSDSYRIDKSTPSNSFNFYQSLFQNISVIAHSVSQHPKSQSSKTIFLYFAVFRNI